MKSRMETTGWITKAAPDTCVMLEDLEFGVYTHYKS